MFEQTSFIEIMQLISAVALAYLTPFDAQQQFRIFVQVVSCRLMCVQQSTLRQSSDDLVDHVGRPIREVSCGEVFGVTKEGLVVEAFFQQFRFVLQVYFVEQTVVFSQVLSASESPFRLLVKKTG